jgi:hypothetical protein
MASKSRWRQVEAANRQLLVNHIDDIMRCAADRSLHVYVVDARSPASKKILAHAAKMLGAIDLIDNKAVFALPQAKSAELLLACNEQPRAFVLDSSPSDQTVVIVCGSNEVVQSRHILG